MGRHRSHRHSRGPRIVQYPLCTSQAVAFHLLLGLNFSPELQLHLVVIRAMVGNTIQHLGEELPMKELLTGLQAGLRSLYVMLWPQRPAATGEHHTRLTLRALTPLEKCCLHPTFALSSFSSSLLRVSIWISFHEVKILIPHCILSFFSVNSQI